MAPPDDFGLNPEEPDEGLYPPLLLTSLLCMENAPTADAPIANFPVLVLATFADILAIPPAALPIDLDILPIRANILL